MLKLAYLLELTWLLVDMASGFLQNHDVFLPGNQTISAVVRLFAFILFLGIVLTYTHAKRLAFLGLLFLSIAWAAVHMVANGLDGPHAVADLQFLLKLLMPLLLFAVLQIQIEQGALTEQRLHRILGLNVAVMLLNLSLGMFGIGFGNYGETDDGELLGSKGFFYAGNEVSATLVALFALTVFAGRARFQRHQIQLFVVVAFFFLASLVSLSKTSLIGFLLILLFVIHSYLSRATKIKFSLVLALSVAASSPWWIPLLQVSIERWEFLWERSPDFLTFITSGRTDRIDRYLEWAANARTPITLIFGEGQSTGELAASYENDLLDLTYNAGLLGLIIYGVWTIWMMRGFVARWIEGRSVGSFTAYILAMFLVLSVAAGHIIYSATLAPFIALLALTSSRNFPGEKESAAFPAPHGGHSPSSERVSAPPP